MRGIYKDWNSCRFVSMRGQSDLGFLSIPAMRGQNFPKDSRHLFRSSSGSAILFYSFGVESGARVVY